MNGRRPIGVALLLACVALALVPFASGRSADVGGTGTIAGSGTTYTIRIANTGTDPILCFQVVLPPGVLATGIGAPPAGWQLGASQPPPAPNLGGRSATGIAPGAAETFTFTTNAVLPNGTQLKLSPDCRTDITVATAGPTAPPPPPPPPPKPQRCQCDSLDVKLDPFFRRLDGTPEPIIVWTLECTKGSGGKCGGVLTVDVTAASRRAGVRLIGIRDQSRADGDARKGRGGSWNVACEGKCHVSEPTSHEGEAFIRFDASEGKSYGRTIKSVTIEVERFCRRELTTKTFHLALNPNGVISKRRSDLNGNGVADGKEKK